MNRKKIASKPAPKINLDNDPHHVALRMRGLARFIENAGGNKEHADPIDFTAAYFIATELEEMAEHLEGV